MSIVTQNVGDEIEVDGSFYEYSPANRLSGFLMNLSGSSCQNLLI